MSFPFSLKNQQICQEQILSVFVYLKMSFCFRFWGTVLMHWEFWVDSFLLLVLWMQFGSLLVSIWMSQVRSQLLITLMLPLYVMSCSLATLIFSLCLWLVTVWLWCARYRSLCIYATWDLLSFLDKLLLRYISGDSSFKQFFSLAPNMPANVG